MTTTQCFVPSVSAMSTMLSATAQSFVPSFSTTPTLGHTSLQSSCMPSVSTVPSTLETSVVEYYSTITVLERSIRLGIVCPHFCDGQVPVAQPDQVHQQPAIHVHCSTEPPEPSEPVCEISSQKPRKGIRNKALPRPHQGLETVNASREAHQSDLIDGCPWVADAEPALLEFVSETSMQGGQQSQQDAEDSDMEKADEVLSTSERSTADVSSSYATGPPGLGRRRAYRSPAKRNRDIARLNELRVVPQEQPAHEVEQEIEQDLGLNDATGATKQWMPSGSMHSGTAEGADLPSALSRSEMLKWRSFVLIEGLPKHTKVCFASFAETDDVQLKNWREEAALTQQKKCKGKGKGKGDQGKYFQNREPGQPVLKESEKSWSAQRKQMSKNLNSPEKSDEEIVRTMKSILNKLTMKKYDTLYQQILNCGMSTVEHVTILIDEVLEKAETQHHFIQMYCQLCVDLHKWFVERSSSSSIDAREHSFKRILLNQCQNKFEDNLSPPDLSSVREDAAQEAMVKHKLAMIGNIKFIGALLEQGMLSDVCLGRVAQELCEANAPHALECLASFLTAVGPKFDQWNFRYYEQLQTIFVQVEEKSKDISIAARIRFLLKNVLDLRKSRWSSAK